MPSRHQHDYGTFQRCSQKYDFNVVRGWEPERLSEKIKIGTILHQALADYYRGLAGWPRAISLGFDGLSDTDLEALVPQCMEIFERYTQEMEPLDPVLIYSVETEYNVNILENDAISLRPDLVLRRGEDSWEIWDHKTVSQFPSNEQPAYDFDTQALTYSWFWWKRTGVVPKFVYNLIKNQMPKRPETPFLKQISFQRSVRDVQAWENELVEQTLAMREQESGDRRPIRSIIKTGGESCSGCPFLHVCMLELFQQRRLGENEMRLAGYKQREAGSNARSGAGETL